MRRNDLISYIVRQYNKSLCDRYPFLKPYDETSGAYPDGSDYEYEFTRLDEMPDGWRIAFGEKMCAEIAEELKKHDRLDDYRIIQIKEKFGELRWYDNGNTDDGYKIIEKYAELSRKTCVICGRPATHMTEGYILPLCDEDDTDECDEYDEYPVRYGYWKNSDGERILLVDSESGAPYESCWCSNCGRWLVASDEYPVDGRYCPYCGSKMDSILGGRDK